MDPQNVFCPNMNCPARGKISQGNIKVHSLKQRLYLCSACGKVFSESKGTAFYRLKKSPETVTQVITLLAHGCPVQAIVAAFNLDERTVRNWMDKASQHCQTAHQQLIEQPRRLGQVQADEIRVKQQGKVVWMALAICVSTRLWLGGVVGEHRDLGLITKLIAVVKASAYCPWRSYLSVPDGLKSYVTAIREVFREAVATGQARTPTPARVGQYLDSAGSKTGRWQQASHWCRAANHSRKIKSKLRRSLKRRKARGR